MKKGIRLYDFSVFYAITVILAYVVLLCLCAGIAAVSEFPLPALIVLFILILSFVALFWYFVGRAPVLGEQQVSMGKISIKKKDLACEIFYQTRYREKALRLYRKSKPNAKGKHECITVQATKSNQKKLADWLGIDVSDIPDFSKQDVQGR